VTRFHDEVFKSYDGIAPFLAQQAEDDRPASSHFRPRPERGFYQPEPCVMS